MFELTHDEKWSSPPPPPAPPALPAVIHKFIRQHSIRLMPLHCLLARLSRGPRQSTRLTSSAARPNVPMQHSLYLVIMCECARHYEIWKYCQSTSRVQAEVLQNLRVPGCCHFALQHISMCHVTPARESQSARYLCMRDSCITRTGFSCLHGVLLSA